MAKETLSDHIESHCARLSAFLEGLDADGRDRVIGRILDTPNPIKTADRIEDLYGGCAAESIDIILMDDELAGPFLSTVGGSRFLFTVLNRSPELTAAMFINGAYRTRKTREDKETEIRARTTEARTPNDFDRELRIYKEQDYLRIGCRDLADIADVTELTVELSALAGASLEAAISFHWERLVFKHGPPPGTGESTGLTVIAMGKLAGGELNFSSDIDLIFLRGPSEGRTEGPERIPTVQFYENLVRAVSRSLSEVTEHGFVFRTDLRLRPEGEKGELVPSVSNALQYYMQWGRTWERAALMKAVPIAGDRPLGRSFVKALEPFLYRRYLDYSTLEDIREMKLRIEAQLRRKPGVNIKLGEGGIREIEFFVQTLQLINAGRHPRLRSPGTIEGLDLLQETGLLEAETAAGLREAYIFFRKTEHRIQINHQLQTHELPRTEEEQHELARRMGYRNDALNVFQADLERHRQFVGDLFSGLFYSEEDAREEGSPDVRKIIDAIDREDVVCELLEKHGFKNPKHSYRLLRGLVLPSETRRVYSDRGRALLGRLAPVFLDELLTLPDPDEALIALDKYVSSLQGKSAYFSTLDENPATSRFLVRILGESRFFTDLLIRHPQSIDSLIGRWTIQRPKERDALELELSGRLDYHTDYESRLDVLRVFKNEQILRVGVSHLTGEIDSLTARWLITEIADVCLEAAVRIASREMERKFKQFTFHDAPPFVILGMGKLGGMEMTYLSDLDVIFVYDPPEDTSGNLTAHEWFTRLASRIISILSAPTAEGIAFEIDTRLRPSGNKGPLVSSLASFEDYHRTSSKLWEKQALTRARPVTGPDYLKERVDRIVRDCVRSTELSDDDIREIDRLRRRMEKELAHEDAGHVDVKTGHGGLVDVEFFAQANVLRHGRSRPHILCRSTVETLAALNRERLIDSETFQTLDEGYRFLIGLEDRLRIMEYKSVDRIALEGDKFCSLARRLGYDEGAEDAFKDDYFRVTRAIRAIYSSFFQANRSAPAE